jgi:hypothetical protein
VLGCIERGEKVGGPLDPELCLTAQRIVDTAARRPPKNAHWSWSHDKSEDAADTDTYALKSADLPEIAAPDLPYRPPMPQATAQGSA